MLGYQAEPAPKESDTHQQKGEGRASCEQQQGGGTIPIIGSQLSHSTKAPPCRGLQGVWHHWAPIQFESLDPTENGRFETLNIF